MSHSFNELFNEVIQKGKCSSCGACVSSCPESLLNVREHTFFSPETYEYVVPKETVQKINEQCISCGLCYDTCPIIEFNMTEAEKFIFGKASTDLLGNAIGVFMGRATNPQILENAQNGGVATALLSYLLHEEYVDSVIAVGSSSENVWKPIPKIIKNPNDLTYTQKTKYFPSATLAKLKDFLEMEDIKSVAITLTPCQMHGLTKMKMKNIKIAKKVKYTIGLFCFGTYWTKDFFEWLKKTYNLEPNDIVKMDLDKSHIFLYLKSGETITEDRAKINKFIRESCKLCQDFTNILADISLGEIGSPPGWTTIIVKNKEILSILEKMENEGLIELKPLSIDNLKVIYSLAETKFKHRVGEHVSRFKLLKPTEVLAKLKEALRIRRNQIKLDPKIEENIAYINIVLTNGLSIYSRMFEKAGKSIDPLIFGGIITAISEFTNEVTGGRGILKGIDLEKLKILVERKNNVIGIMVSKVDNAMVREVLRTILDRVNSSDIINEVKNGVVTQEIEEKVDNLVKSVLGKVS